MFALIVFVAICVLGTVEVVINHNSMIAAREKALKAFEA